MPEGGFFASPRRSRPASEEDRCSPAFLAASLPLSVALPSGLPARGRERGRRGRVSQPRRHPSVPSRAKGQ